MQRVIRVGMMVALLGACGGTDTGPGGSDLSATLTSAHSGQTTGGMPVTFVGSGFGSATIVAFGGTAATNVEASLISMTATTPAHAAGTVDIVIKDPGGATVTLPGGFIYADLKGSWSGTTSQAQPISFVVDSTNTLTSLTYGFSIQGASCTTTGTSVATNTAIDVSSMNFIHAVPNDSLTGSFTSTTAASGTFRVTTPAGCVGTTTATWNATKH